MVAEAAAAAVALAVPRPPRFGWAEAAAGVGWVDGGSSSMFSMSTSSSSLSFVGFLKVTVFVCDRTRVVPLRVVDTLLSSISSTGGALLFVVVVGVVAGEALVLRLVERLAKLLLLLGVAEAVLVVAIGPRFDLPVGLGGAWGFRSMLVI